MNTQQIDLQQYTKLPLKIISVANISIPSVIITTPHSGEITLELKESKGGGLFGGNSEHSKSLLKIVGQLQEIENAAKDYLLEHWKGQLK